MFIADVHEIAHRYLQGLKDGNGGFYNREQEAGQAILKTCDSLSPKVVVIREEQPRFLAGFMKSGRPAWTHEAHLAISHDLSSHEFETHLSRLSTYGIEFHIMPTSLISAHI